MLRRWPGGVLTEQVAFEPVGRVRDDRVQSAGLREEVTGAGHDLQRLRALQQGVRLFVQFDDAVIGAADDQQGRRAYPVQRFAGKIGTPAARHDRADAIAKPDGGGERGRRAGARAEKPERKPGQRRFAFNEMDSIGKPLRQQSDIEDIRAVGFFLRGEKVEQERADAPVIEGGGDGPIARAEAAGAAPMRRSRARARRSEHAEPPPVRPAE